MFVIKNSKVQPGQVPHRVGELQLHGARHFHTWTQEADGESVWSRQLFVHCHEDESVNREFQSTNITRDFMKIAKMSFTALK